MKRILITGGAGFVGANLSIFLKEHISNCHIIAFDNLHRRGSELNIKRLRQYGIEFVHGDIRNISDLQTIAPCDWLIECSAEPSVLAGYATPSEYLLHSNLTGALNCLQWAKEHNSGFLFLSTSRVYPHSLINSLPIRETDTRFEIDDEKKLPRGISKKGISEQFLLEGTRTLYGATKLAVELILEEYREMYHLPVIINRCGIIAGPWQMGKIDQGVVAHWLAHHIAGKSLAYIGYNGSGKQVRDLLDIQDLCQLVLWQLNNYEKCSPYKFNIGGGPERSFSLLELTTFCQQITKNKIPITCEPQTRPGDIPYYVTDTSLIESISPWRPTVTLEQTLTNIAEWICSHKAILNGILF